MKIFFFVYNLFNIELLYFLAFYLRNKNKTDIKKLIKKVFYYFFLKKIYFKIKLLFITEYKYNHIQNSTSNLMLLQFYYNKKISVFVNIQVNFNSKSRFFHFIIKKMLEIIITLSPKQLFYSKLYSKINHSKKKFSNLFN